jgi:hypothetical protein
MLTPWKASSYEALRERMRIGEKRLQLRRDRQGALVPPDEGQRPVAGPLDDHEQLTSTASPRTGYSPIRCVTRRIDGPDRGFGRAPGRPIC